MLRFLSKIRKNLLGEGQVSRYLLYALGEILLVVIGILLALQVNDWNQKRLDRFEEREILSNLNEDFQKSIEEFNFLNSLRSEIISAAKEITRINIKNLDLYPIQYIDSLFSKTLTGPTFNNESGSLQVLLTSGKINLIKNPELRKTLIEWPGDVADMIEDEINQDELYRGPYQEFLSRHISWNDMIKSYSNNQVRFNKISLDTMPETSIIKSDYLSVLGSMYFLNMLHQRASLCMISTQETNVLIGKSKSIIQLIDNELDRYML